MLNCVQKLSDDHMVSPPILYNFTTSSILYIHLMCFDSFLFYPVYVTKRCEVGLFSIDTHDGKQSDQIQLVFKRYWQFKPWFQITLRNHTFDIVTVLTYMCRAQIFTMGSVLPSFRRKDAKPSSKHLLVYTYFYAWGQVIVFECIVTAYPLKNCKGFRFEL